MNERSLLVISTGRTDVQLVVKDSSGNIVRREVYRDEVRDVHTALEQDHTQWTIEVAPPRPSRATKSVGTRDRSTPKCPDLLPDLTEKFTVCTPKLDAALAYLKKENINLTHVLILDTRRTQGDDPFFSGRVLQRRIKDLLPSVSVSVCTFLGGKEDLEDTRNQLDAVIRREVVQKIESAFATILDESGAKTITLSLTGGFPKMDDVIEEIVRLRMSAADKEFRREAQKSVTVINTPESRRGGVHNADTAIPVTAIRPHEPYNVRRHALELLHEGHVLGAWGAAKVFEDNSNEKYWVNVFWCLYEWASSLQIDEKSCELTIVKNKLRAVRAALYVEFAIRAGNIPAVVHGAVAFLEAAFWDHLLADWLEQDTNNSREYTFKSDVPDKRYIRTGIPGDKADRNRPFEVAQRDDNDQPVKRFRVDETAACELANFLSKSAVTAYRIALDPIRKYRNDTAHNVPTPAIIERAKREMEQAKLWSSSNSFLATPLVKAVLVELGVDNPGDLLNQLFSEVSKIVVPPVPQPQSP